MGKIIQQPVEFIKDNTEHMLDNQFSDYTKFLGSAPIFVTYYNQNIIDTTLDNGFGNTYGNVTSEESSKKYNKINDLPLFKVPKSDLEMIFDDNRLSISFESEGTLLPNTIEPIPEDYLIISYMEKIRIFKVTGFEVDNIKSNRYFKIKFKFNIDGVDHIDKLEKRVINEYTCIYNNAGTQETCLILNENCNYIEQLQNKFDELSEEYIDNFYDKKHDAFLFFWNHANILYDPYLTKFISDNKLFEKDFSFHSLHIEEKIPPLRNFKKKYLESIFHSLEKRKKIDVYRRSFRTVRIYDLSSSFGSSAFMYCQVEVNSNDEYKCLYNIPYLDFHFIKEEDPIGETLKLRASYLFDEDIEEENIEDENKLNGKLTYKAKDKSYMNSSFNFEKEDESLINVISKLKADDESSINGRFNYEAEDNSLIPASTEFKYLAPLVYQKKVDPQIEVFKEIIREYFRNNSTKESSKLILQLLDEFTLEYRFDYMIYTPMILFILKSFINNITINKE